MIDELRYSLTVGLVANLVQPDPERVPPIERLSAALAQHAGQQAVGEAMHAARIVAIHHMRELMIPVIQQQRVTPTLELAERVARMSAALVRVGGPEALESLINTIEPPAEPSTRHV